MEDLALDDYFVCEPHLPPQEPLAPCLDPADAELVLDTSGKVLFNPHYTRHPRSSKWTPPDHISRYLQIWMRKLFERDARNRLRAECLHLTIPGRVSAAP